MLTFNNDYSPLIKLFNVSNYCLQLIEIFTVKLFTVNSYYSPLMEKFTVNNYYFLLINLTNINENY